MRCAAGLTMTARQSDTSTHFAAVQCSLTARFRSMLMHIADAVEPFDPSRLRSIDRGECRTKLRLHELSLGRLRLPDFDDDQLVPLLSRDVTQHARWPMRWVWHAVPSEVTVHL